MECETDIAKCSSMKLTLTKAQLILWSRTGRMILLFVFHGCFIVWHALRKTAYLPNPTCWSLCTILEETLRPPHSVRRGSAARKYIP